MLKEIFCSNFSIVFFAINICINRTQLVFCANKFRFSFYENNQYYNEHICIIGKYKHIAASYISIFRRTLFVSCEQRIAIPSRSFAYRSMSAKYQVKRVNFPSHVNAKVCAPWFTALHFWSIHNTVRPRPLSWTEQHPGMALFLIAIHKGSVPVSVAR